MKISIVSPSFNQGRFLERTLLSVWTQQGDFDLEHLVMDGGSTDESLDILKKYELLYKKRTFPIRCRSLSFLWRSEADQGQADALNRGFALSSGEILGWLNSDDLLAGPESLHTVCKVFQERHAADLVVGNVRMIDEDDREIQAPILINTLDDRAFQKRLPGMDRVCLIAQPACFFRRHVWEKLGIAPYYYSLDWYFWIEAYKASYTFFKTETCLAAMRQHPEAKTVIAGLAKYREVLSIYRKNRVWCLNRVYYYIYFWLLYLETWPVAGPAFRKLLPIGKKVRNSLINRFRLY